MDKIKIIIADDHSLFVNGLQLLLKGLNEIEVLDVASNGRELLNILSKQKPDIVLLDINMPELNGLEACKLIKQNYREIKLIILSTYDEEHLVDKAKQLGVNGYLLKNSSRDELLQTIQLVMNNQTSFPYLQPKEINYFSEQDNFLKQYHLTKRETEIIQLIKQGATNQQLADKLFLSIYTIETHRKNIMLKLGLNSPVALMKFILKNNI